jgi:hypothetical protein
MVTMSKPASKPRSTVAKKPAAKTAAKKTVAKAVKKAPARRAAPASKAGKPLLLSGGNPQADGDAPVQAYIAAMPGWKSAVGSRLDALVSKAVPGLRKAVRWNSPFYGSKDGGWFLSFHVFTKYIKVTFFDGQSLKPLPPGPSKDKKARYLDIHEDEPFDEAQFTAWVKQASNLPGWAGS